MISVCIIVHNEEKLIKRCLESIKDIGNEIIIIDDYSTDDTISICKKYTNKVYQRRLKNDFAGQRNYAASKAKNEWIFMIDADEFATGKLVDNINRLTMTKKYDVFTFPRTVYYKGKRLKSKVFSETDRVPRLYNKKKAKYVGKVHEIVKASPENICDTNLFIEHKPLVSLFTKEYFKKKALRYLKIDAIDCIEWRASKGFKRKYPLIYLPIGVIGTFIYYIVKGALRDGYAGLKASLYICLYHTYLYYYMHKQNCSKI